MLGIARTHPSLVREGSLPHEEAECCFSFTVGVIGLNICMDMGGERISMLFSYASVEIVERNL